MIKSQSNLKQNLISIIRFTNNNAMIKDLFVILFLCLLGHPVYFYFQVPLRVHLREMYYLAHRNI